MQRDAQYMENQNACLKGLLILEAPAQIHSGFN